MNIILIYSPHCLNTHLHNTTHPRVEQSKSISQFLIKTSFTLSSSSLIRVYIHTPSRLTALIAQQPKTLHKDIHRHSTRRLHFSAILVSYIFNVNSLWGFISSHPFIHTFILYTISSSTYTNTFIEWVASMNDFIFVSFNTPYIFPRKLLLIGENIFTVEIMILYQTVITLFYVLLWVVRISLFMEEAEEFLSFCFFFFKPMLM